MTSPFEERLRLGYLLGNIRQLTQLDADATLNSITRPDEVPTRGTRMMYKGEIASDISINRISAALAGQTDFALMDLIRVRPVQRKQVSIRHGADADKVVCWGVNPVLLPTLAADLGSHIGVVDSKDARLSNVSTWADLAPIDVERWNGGAPESVYNAGVFEFDNLALTTVDTLYPWGIQPTNDVRMYLTGTIDAEIGTDPNIYTVTLDAGTMSASYLEGLFYSVELGYGCIISGYDAGTGQITLLDTWAYGADPTPGSDIIIIGKTHTVPGMVAVLSGGDAANNGNYLITDIDDNGALILNALPASVTTWDDLQDPLPCHLLTGDGVATGSVQIVTPFVWFPVITFDADVTITAPYNLPLKVAYKAPLSLRDIAQEDTTLFEEIVSPTVIDLLNKIGGTPTTGYWDADPVDSLYNIDLRLDAVTLDAAYRNKTKVSSYEGAMTTDSPATGAFITVDGHAVGLKTSAATIFSHTPDPALAFRAHAGAGYRAIDRVTEGTALGVDQVFTLEVGGATNPQLGGGETIQLEIDVLGPTFKLICSSMTKSTSVIRDGSTDCMPSVLYFKMSTGSRWAGMAFAESVTTNAGGCDITLGFLSTPPTDGSALYDIEYLYVCAPAGLEGVAVGNDLGRGLEIFTQRTVPWREAYDVGFMDVVENSTTMYWLDKNPTDAESLGYRFMGTGARMGRRTLYDSLPMTDIEMEFSLGLTPEAPLLSLLDLSEGYDDATDLTERMTQMIGAPLYRNQDANTIYTGPFAGRRHGRQLVYTSSADVPKTSLLDTGVDTLLFGTAHAKQHEM